MKARKLDQILRQGSIFVIVNINTIKIPISGGQIRPLLIFRIQILYMSLQISHSIKDCQKHCCSDTQSLGCFSCSHTPASQTYPPPYCQDRHQGIEIVDIPCSWHHCCPGHCQKRKAEGQCQNHCRLILRRQSCCLSLCLPGLISISFFQPRPHTVYSSSHRQNSRLSNPSPQKVHVDTGNIGDQVCCQHTSGSKVASCLFRHKLILSGKLMNAGRENTDHCPHSSKKADRINCRFLPFLLRQLPQHIKSRKKKGQEYKIILGQKTKKSRQTDPCQKSGLLSVPNHSHMKINADACEEGGQHIHPNIDSGTDPSGRKAPKHHSRCCCPPIFHKKVGCQKYHCQTASIKYQIENHSLPGSIGIWSKGADRMQKRIKKRRMYILCLVVPNRTIGKSLPWLDGHIFHQLSAIHPTPKNILGYHKWLIIAVGQSPGIDFINKISLFLGRKQQEHENLQNNQESQPLPPVFQISHCRTSFTLLFK